jgi:hypothetical protein
MDSQYRPWGRTKAVVGQGRFEDFPFRPFSAHGQRACVRPVSDLGKSSRARNAGDSSPPARDDFPLAPEKGGNGLTPTSRRFQTLPLSARPVGGHPATGRAYSLIPLRDYVDSNLPEGWGLLAGDSANLPEGRSPLAGDSSRHHRLQAGSAKSRESPLESELV